MIERVAIVVGVVVATLLVAYMVRSHARRRVRSLHHTGLPAPLAARLDGRRPGIVYFYGPHCATCRGQAEVLNGLSAVDAVEILPVDASQDTGLADQLSVMTVPTTVVVDRSQRVRSINPGFRSTDVLRAQLHAISAE